MLTQEELKKNFEYNPITGEFKRLNSMRPHINPIQNEKVYRQIKINKKLYKAHRLAFLYMTGIWPNDGVDHINGIKSDNRWSNLRPACSFENHRNRKVSSKSKSGFIGVYRALKTNGYNVHIGRGGMYANRYFCDKHYGSENLALMAAAFFSIRKRAEIGFHINHGRQV